MCVRGKVRLKLKSISEKVMKLKAVRGNVVMELKGFRVKGHSFVFVRQVTQSNVNKCYE